MQMQKRIVAGVTLLAGLTAAPALAAASGPQVSVRLEGLNSTLLAAKTISVPAGGSITKGGVTPGLCPADSAQGALAVATRGNWTGSWSASFKEYEVTGILGDTPNIKRDYYEIFVNNVAASTGACEIKLKAGAKLLFAVVPDSGKAETPLGITWQISDSKLVAKVIAYNARGIASPLSGAKVTADRRSSTTAADGTATFPAPARTETLVATASGHIRDEITVSVAR
jgi:hypothetical protein